ncbi:Ankyrin repeat domain-containing protein 44 [Toensbergia leucococca]|nr:Ankyrin repeat domain-containing protein 44 [Toensbergia leucococca]
MAKLLYWQSSASGTPLDGQIPLYIASEAGHLAMVIWLLECGVETEMNTNTRGLTPLHIAAENGHADVVETLIAAGSCAHNRSKSGATPFYRAAQSGSLKTLKLLYAAGCDINARTWDNCTAIYEAIKRGHLAVFDQLLLWGANICLSSLEGWTPLVFALFEFYQRTPIKVDSPHFLMRLLLKLGDIERLTGSSVSTEEAVNFRKKTGLQEPLRENMFNSMLKLVLKFSSAFPHISQPRLPLRPRQDSDMDDMNS